MRRRSRPAAVGRIGYWCWETMTPLVAGSYQAARAAVDVALTAADLLLAGDAAVYGLARPPGHHCPRSAFGGYGLFNYSAAAQRLPGRPGRPGRGARRGLPPRQRHAADLLPPGRRAVRVAARRPRPGLPLLHRLGRRTRRGPGEGFTLNLPLPAGCTNDRYLAALDTALERVAEHSAAALVVSLGLDTYGQDPIADFALSTDVYHEVSGRVVDLGLPTLVLQEGGYFVPKLGENARTWLRGLLGRPLDPARDAGLTWAAR